MGFESGLVIGGVIVLGIVGLTVGGLLWFAGLAITALPKGVSLRDLATIGLVAALGVAVSKALAALEVVPPGLVRAVSIEALVLLGACGVAWLFTKEA